MSVGKRTWNPLWTDIEDSEANPTYNDRLRRMVIASINWSETHPNSVAKWRELDKEKLLGDKLPPGVSIDQVQIVADWDVVYHAENEAAEEWFSAIVEACVEGEEYPEDAAPTALMFTKAIACGIMMKRSGWDGFNQFMISPRDDETAH